MPSIIQTALAFEALLNVPGIVSLVCFPSQTLGYLLASPLPSLELNGTAVFLARSFGLLILALTPQLLLAYPNSKDSVGKRKLVYMTLGMGEVVLIPLLLWEAFRATDASKAAGIRAGGLSRSFCLTATANLLPLLAWRVFVFQLKPQWFGVAEDVSMKAKKDH